MEGWTSLQDMRDAEARHRRRAIYSCTLSMLLIMVVLLCKAIGCF